MKVLLLLNETQQLHKENCNRESDNNILSTYFDMK